MMSNNALNFFRRQKMNEKNTEESVNTSTEQGSIVKEKEPRQIPFIVRGSMHQGNCIFPVTSRGKQCTAMAAAAILTSNIKRPKLWDPIDIGTILRKGDSIFHGSKATRLGVDINEKNRSYLTAEELCKSIRYGTDTYKLEVIDIINGHLDDDDSDGGFPNLYNLLKFCLHTKKSGVFTCQSSSVALIYVDDHIGIFDSHSRNLDGEITADGTACFFVKQNIEELLPIIKNNIPTYTLGSLLNGGEYQFTSLSFVKSLSHSNYHIDTPVLEKITPQKNELPAPLDHLNMNPVEILRHDIWI